MIEISGRAGVDRPRDGPLAPLSPEVDIARFDDRLVALVATAPVAAMADRFRPSPIAVTPDHVAMIDGRIDNRMELAAALGWRGPARDDAALILAGWARWGEALLDRLVGDYALVVVDRRRRRVVLARDPAAQRPLFYALFEGTIAFASRPLALALRPGHTPRWDRQRLADGLAGLMARDGHSLFAGVRAVPPGGLVRWSAEEVAVARWFAPSLEPLRLAGQEDYVAAYREQLDRAVMARIDGLSRPIVAQLSSGYDSAAVAATAARLAGGSPLLALTAAPPLGYAPQRVGGRATDESGLAALVAAQHGMRHCVLRQPPRLSLDGLRMTMRRQQDPFSNLLNGLWHDQCLAEARAAGATVMLGGALGNATLNAGAVPALGELFAQSEWRRWAREALALHRAGGGSGWRIVADSAGPSLPGWLDQGARRLIGRARTPPPGRFAGPALRDLSPSPVERPPRRPAADRLASIARLDKALLVKGAALELGVAELDPFADRRLIEFSLRLPPEQLVANGVARPLARRALADRLPVDVIECRHRGVQLANWHDAIDRHGVREIVEEISANATVRELVDLAAIERAIARWPTGAAPGGDDELVYASELPSALALGVLVIEVERAAQGTA